MKNKIRIIGGRELLIDGKYINPKKSQNLFNKSPDGFAFGYYGSGPAQAALAIMMEYTDDNTALRLYQKFKEEYVATWKEPDMEIELDIKEWINIQKREIKINDPNTIKIGAINYVVPEDRVIEMLKKYECPETEWWLIEDSTIETAEKFYGIDTIMDITNDKDYKRCIYHHENGAITYFAGYNNEQEFEEACKYITKMLKE